MYVNEQIIKTHSKLRCAKRRHRRRTDVNRRQWGNGVAYAKWTRRSRLSKSAHARTRTSACPKWRSCATPSSTSRASKTCSRRRHRRHPRLQVRRLGRWQRRRTIWPHADIRRQRRRQPRLPQARRRRLRLGSSRRALYTISEPALLPSLPTSTITGRIPLMWVLWL